MKKARGLIEFLVFFILVAVIVAVGMRISLNQMEEQRLNNEYYKQEQANTKEIIDYVDYNTKYDNSDEEQDQEYDEESQN